MACRPWTTARTRRRWLRRAIVALLIGLLFTSLVARLYAILLAYGNSGDLWPPSVHERYAEELDARTAVYDGVGHRPSPELPARVCTDLIAFWTESNSH